LRAHLVQMGMKTDLREIPGVLPDADELLRLMGQDKKVVDGRLRFVLARGIGQAFAGAEVDNADVLTLLRDALSARQ
jgi:3-dehydroquinate synthase